MNKHFICTVIVIFSYLNVFAQKIYNFQLAPAQTKIYNSLYNSLTVLDYRGDTTSIGFIHTGMMDRYARVVSGIPISNQFKALFNSITDTTAADGKLLLQIMRLIFAERENSFTSNAYFNMRANLYAVISGHYIRVGTIDTLVSKSAIDPTSEILKSGNEIMTGFIIKNLKIKPSGPVFMYHDILNINNIEKNDIALYNRNDYTDGLYLTYKAFKNQMPDRQIVANSDDLNSGDIRTIEGDGVTLKVKAHNVYAIVYKGQPYVVSDGVYYPLKKRGSDFFFVAKAEISLRPEDELVSDIAGGSAGYRTATFEMMIDYKNGLFLRLKKIPNAKNESR